MRAIAGSPHLFLHRPDLVRARSVGPYPPREIPPAVTHLPRLDCRAASAVCASNASSVFLRYSSPGPSRLPTGLVRYDPEGGLSVAWLPLALPCRCWRSVYPGLDRVSSSAALRAPHSGAQPLGPRRRPNAPVRRRVGPQWGREGHPGERGSDNELRRRACAVRGGGRVRRGVIKGSPGTALSPFPWHELSSPFPEANQSRIRSVRGPTRTLRERYALRTVFSFRSPSLHRDLGTPHAGLVQVRPRSASGLGRVQISGLSLSGVVGSPEKREGSPEPRERAPDSVRGVARPVVLGTCAGSCQLNHHVHSSSRRGR